MEETQVDGYYPRVNSALVQSGNFNGKIVSLVGRFTPPHGHDGTVGFRCSDDGVLRLSTEHAESPPLDTPDGPIVEVVGQVMEPNLVVLFVTRELTKDMDLGVYDKMIQVQHNPKFAHYFLPVPHALTTN